MNPPTRAVGHPAPAIEGQEQSPTDAGAAAGAPPHAPCGSEAQSTVARVRALDGLRGLAAIVVVIHHSVLALPAADRALDGSAPVGSTAWWLTYSPLHVIWAGEEAVLVFFVLSGFVLALPATLRAVRWRAYYVKRLLRIYLPVWGSLIVAVVLAELTRTERSPRRSDYVNDRADVSLLEAPRDALLVAGAGLLNGPLWSLQWEMIFSLLLPVYLLLGRPSLVRRHRIALPVVVAGLFGSIALGTLLDSTALRFLPMFGVGVVMAFNQDELRSAAYRIARAARPRLAWHLLVALTLVLLTGRWMTAGLPFQHPLLDAVGSGGSFVGACLTVFLALHWPPARAILGRRPWLWLGTVSFSLYVIHEPIIVAVALLLPSGVGGWVTPVVALPLALLAATAFYRLVEGPAHRLARAVGRGVEGPRRSPSIPTEPAAKTA